MPEPEGDSLFALSSAPGRAGVAVIRVSGPRAGAALRALTGGALPPARVATLAGIRGPGPASAEALIDRGLVLWFPAPASFTGEDVAEIQLHGGRAVVAATLAALAAQPGCRMAEPGEFTRRAFHAGKLDLAAVEGLADLIDADTEAQRVQALRQLGGALGRRTEALRERLVGLLALLEAEIDFVDEADVPDDLLPRVRAGLEEALAEIEALLAGAEQGERLRDGVQVAILGAPNVGKSSLLNALARRDVAIVSEAAGTTRDVLEVHLDLAGLPVTLADTAGLRSLEGDTEEAGGGAHPTAMAQARIEAEGMRRARERAESADIRVVVVECAAEASGDAETTRLLERADLVAANKSDLHPFAAASVSLQLANCPVIAVSALTGEGLGPLIKALTGLVAARLDRGGEAALVTRARQREALADARGAIRRILDGGGRPLAAELLAEDLRLACRAVGRIAGRVDVEDVLDAIFRDFCIGK